MHAQSMRESDSPPMQMTDPKKKKELDCVELRTMHCACCRWLHYKWINKYIYFFFRSWLQWVHTFPHFSFSLKVFVIAWLNFKIIHNDFEALDITNYVTETSSTQVFNVYDVIIIP